LGGDGLLRNYAKGFEEDDLLVDLSADTPPAFLLHDYLEDLYKALVLGVRDYFKKQGFTKACLGLSGGIDSALVACIAVEALGKEQILAVLLPSRYSSEGSITDAVKLADKLGIARETISIEGPFQSYLDLLAPAFGNRPADTAEENIQARIRGMILMALSNKLGYIVLSTGNKSDGLFNTLWGPMRRAGSDQRRHQGADLCVGPLDQQQ
jgi:NAD+ synthase (glutamine-hydrolysing)